MVFRNEFSWSKSRDSLFRSCPRKYWFNHYGFWNGWVASEEERVKRIYYLKKLATKEVWVGARVHEVIEMILKRLRVGEEVSLGYAQKILRSRMESDWALSKMGGYTGFVTKAHRFFEDEYGVEVSEEEKKVLFEKAEMCLTNFYNSDVFMEIRRTSVEDWITLEDFLSFDFEGVRVFLSIDFAMWKDGKVVLYDWKTGSERRKAGKLQLGLYALYLSEKLGVRPEEVEAVMFYLGIGPEGRVDSYQVSEEWLAEVKGQVRDSVAGMKELLEVSEENLALPEEKFERVEGRQCSKCSFARVCLGSWKD